MRQLLKAKATHKSGFLLSLFLALIVVAGGAHTVSAASGLYTSSPKEANTFHALRTNDGNGQNVQLNFAIYSEEGASAPTVDPRFRVVIDGRTEASDKGNCVSSSSNKISLTNVTPSQINAVCPQTQVFTATGAWTYDDDIGRYRLDVVMTLTGSKKSVANFRIDMLTADYFIGFKKNPNDSEGYAVNNLTTTPTYAIEFARSPCVGGAGGTVGVYDPLRNDLKLYEIDRITGASTEIWSKDNASGEKKVISHSFFMRTDKWYKFTINMDKKDDTVSFLWPEDTVYAGSKQCYRYTLQPFVDNVQPSFAVPGQTISINSHVKSDLRGRTPAINWRLVRVQDSQVVSTGQQHFNYGDNSLPAVQDIALNLPVGSQVCYRLEISPWSNRDANNGPLPDGINNTTWRNSSEVCYKIAKKPTVHISGGDLRARSAGSSVSTQYFQIGTSYYGSWVEYGVFATALNGKASGSDRIASGNPATAAAPYAFSSTPYYADGLTFANTSSPTFGNFGTLSETLLENNFPGTHPILDCASRLTASGYHDCGSSNITIPVGTINGSYIIRTTGTVTIAGNGNLQYDDSRSYTNVSELPQLVIIAGRINIEANVGRVDAWLITTGAGRIDTCSNRPAPQDRLTASICNTPLTVNGPVKTRTLVLPRTHGGFTGNLSEAAENFNLRPDAYLWLYNYLYGSGTRLRTTSVTELSPRY